jgi:hypothetical protein
MSRKKDHEPVWLDFFRLKELINHKFSFLGLVLIDHFRAKKNSK